MKKSLFIAIMASSVLLLTLSTCKRDLHLTPPAGAQILTFTENTHVKNRFIYQGQAEGVFKSGDASRVYWGGVNTPEPSHRLHARLLGNVQDIYFTLTFPKSGKKIFSTPNREKEIMGCSVPAQDLKENEFIIEVTAPRGLKLDRDPEYRIFVGIEGDKALKFYGVNEHKKP